MMGGFEPRARNVTGGCQHVGMRPALKAGLLPLWRDRDTIQFGVDPRRAVALGGLGQAAAVISLLDGSRDREALIATAQAYGVPAAAVNRVLTTLAAAGVLDDFPARLHAALPDQLRARLAPELATASLAYGDGDGGARTLARRRAAFVRVHGAGRTGACVASLLAASGVGHVTCTDPEPAGPADLAPGGLIQADLGAPRQEGAARAISRAASEVTTRGDDAVPDLVVLTELTLPDLIEELMRDRVPHLVLRAAEAIGVVGPLVQPGRSACLRCVDLRKADGDPQWPKVLAQATFTRAQPQACDTVLAAMTAAVAAAQALAFIDRPGVPGSLPAAANGTLEVVLPDWQWRRRTWAPHPACGCGALPATAGTIRSLTCGTMSG
jgi:bacteriocin biosynthesis cyclodehydratase domain-containing protein